MLRTNTNRRTNYLNRNQLNGIDELERRQMFAATASSEFVRVDHNDLGLIEIPHVECACMGESITFVDSLSYEPAKDDDMSFRIVPGPSGSISPMGSNNYYWVDVWDTNRESAHVSLRLKTFALPEGVEVKKRDTITLEGKRDSATHDVEITEGYESVTILELLEYDTGKDDDLLYATRAFGVGNLVTVSALSDFGDSDSRITIRYTVLQWPEDLGVELNDTIRLRADKNGEHQYSMDGNRPMLVSPTMYLTDTSKYPPSAFPSTPGQFLDQLGGSSSIGNQWEEAVGFFGNVTVAGAEIVAGTEFSNPQLILQGVKDLVDSIENGVSTAGRWFGDDRDDDFWFRLTVDEGSRDTEVRLNVGDGNRYSSVEATLWSFNFPECVCASFVPAPTTPPVYFPPAATVASSGWYVVPEIWGEQLPGATSISSARSSGIVVSQAPRDQVLNVTIERDPLLALGKVDRRARAAAVDTLIGDLNALDDALRLFTDIWSIG